MARPERAVPPVGELRGTRKRQQVETHDPYWRPVPLATIDETARRWAKQARWVALVALLTALVGTTTLGWYSWWLS